MRRDSFLSIFLLCLCISLLFACLTPDYFLYGRVAVREFGIMETVFSWLFTVAVFLIIPVYAAWRKRMWLMLGLSSFSLLSGYVPLWILPRISESDNLLTTVAAAVLKEIYTVSRAPFAAQSLVFGDAFAEAMLRKIFPLTLIIYMLVQLFRFYRNAYLAEKVSPADAIDITARENIVLKNEGIYADRRLPPEVLGTVISAPVGTPSAVTSDIAKRRETARPAVRSMSRPMPRPMTRPASHPAADDEASSSGDLQNK